MPPKRQYEATRHARERLAERYRVELTEETWLALAEQIEDWSHEVTDIPCAGTEIRLANVQLAGPDGTVLVVPIVYLSSRWLLRILTVRPGGARLRRHHAAAHP